MSTAAESALTASLQLDDGRRLQLRPMASGDTAALLAMHRRLSPRTVYQRFFASVPELPRDQAERFTHVDGITRVAVVAADADGQLVGVGRYDRLAPGGRSAEVAVVVTDDYQHHGVGTALLAALMRHARAHQVSELVADVLTSNTAMFHTFADAGLHSTTSFEAGVAHLVMPLSPGVSAEPVAPPSPARPPASDGPDRASTAGC